MVSGEIISIPLFNYNITNQGPIFNQRFAHDYLLLRNFQQYEIFD